MNEPSPTFSIVKANWDTHPIEHTMTWTALAARLARHDEGEKDGTALICGRFKRPEQEEIGDEGWRRSKYLTSRELVALDIEQQEGGLPPPDPEIVVARLKLAEVASVLWTTFSHTPDNPRYRIVMPLTEPIAIADWEETPARVIDRSVSSWIALRLKLLNFVDKGKFGSGSLMYLARHPPGTTTHGSWIVQGTPLEAGSTRAGAMMSAKQNVMSATQKQAIEQSQRFPEEVRQRIEAFNDGHDVERMLGQYGYARHGDRWKSTYQHPNSAPATSIYQGNLWTSFSESDKDAGLGTVADSGECIFGDAFALFLHYEHRGNFRSALRAIGGNPNADRSGAGS